MSIVPYTEKPHTTLIDVPIQSEQELKNELTYLLKSLYVDLKNKHPKQQRNTVEIKQKIKEDFLEEFSKLPRILDGTVTFNSLEYYPTTLAHINAEFGSFLKSMNEEARANLLNKSLKSFKFEYFRTLQRKSPDARQIPAQPSKTNKTCPKPTAVKAGRKAEKIIGSIKLPPKETPATPPPSTPKRKPKSAHIKPLPSPTYNTLEEGFSDLVKLIKEEAARQNDASIQDLTSLFNETLKTLPNTLKESKVGKNKPQATPVAPSLNIAIRAVTTQFADTLKSMKVEEIHQLLQDRLQIEFPDDFKPVQSPSIDPATNWINLFTGSQALKDAESIATALTLWLDKVKNDEKLNASLDAWSASFKALQSLKSQSDKLFYSVMRKFNEEYLKDAIDHLFEQLTDKSEKEKNKGRDFFKCLLTLTPNLQDLNNLNKYTQLITRFPFLYDSSTYKQKILPLVKKLTSQFEKPLLYAALDILYSTPKDMDGSETDTIYSLVIKLVLHHEKDFNDNPEIAKKIFALIDKLKESDSILQLIEFLSTLKIQQVADKVIECALDKGKNITKNRKIDVDMLDKHLNKIEHSLKSALKQCSADAFTNYNSEIFKLAKTLSTYQIPVDNLYIQLIETCARFSSPEDYPNDPFRSFKQCLSLIDRNKIDLSRIAKILTNYVLNKSDFNQDNPEKILLSRLNAMVSILLPQMNKLQGNQRRDMFIKSDLMRKITETTIDLAAYHDKFSVYYLKAALDFYCEWTSEISLSHVDWTELFLPEMIKGLNNAFVQNKEGTPEQKQLLNAVWTTMNQSILFLKDLPLWIKALGTKAEFIKYINHSIKLLENHSSIDNDSHESATSETRTQTHPVSALTNPYFILKSVWQNQIDISVTGPKIWDIFIDHFLEVIVKICKDVPDIENPKHKEAIAAANEILAACNLIVEEKLKNSLTQSLIKGKDAAEREALICRELNFYQDTLNRMLESSTRKEMPGMAYGSFLVKYANRVFSNVITTKEEKKLLLEKVLTFAADYSSLFVNDDTLLNNLFTMINSGLQEGRKNTELFLMIFDDISGTASLSQPQSHPDAQENLLFATTYLYGLDTDNAGTLADRLNQKYLKRK